MMGPVACDQAESHRATRGPVPSGPAEGYNAPVVRSPVRKTRLKTF
jgi:hypothetical protein